MYNSFLVYCRELAPGTVSLTGDWAQGDDSKHDSHYIDFFTVYATTGAEKCNHQLVVATTGAFTLTSVTIAISDWGV